MTNTVDKKEIEQFSSLSNKWWDKSGPFSALHKLSNARIEFIKRNARRIVDGSKTETKLLEGLECLDVGCGGGILSEKLSRLGANVLGIDASESAIQTARYHSKKSRLKIDYKYITTSEMANTKNQNFKNKFDLVIASEVIEHVNNRNLFLSDISKVSKPGGIIVFTTINQSILGVFFGKYIAEYVIKVIPPNTHNPEKFVSPKKLIFEAKKHNIILDDITGFVPTFNVKDILQKQFGEFKLSSKIDVNYGLAGINVKPNDRLATKECSKQ